MEKAHQIYKAVERAYSIVAERPRDKHPFPVGRPFAESLGYPKHILSEIPSVSVEAFSGVSNVSVFANIPMGAIVLDLGCGAGLDALIAAKKSGAHGKIIGIDFSSTMLSRAIEAVTEVWVKNVEFLQANAESIPLKNDSIDVALVNGIFNLNPNRDA